MIAAAPRRNANGLATIRPIRTGTRRSHPALVGGDHLLDGVGLAVEPVQAASAARDLVPEPPPERALRAGRSRLAQRGEPASVGRGEHCVPSGVHRHGHRVAGSGGLGLSGRPV